jgi:hypothetical protein
MVNLFLEEKEKEGDSLPAYIATISQSTTTRINGLAASHTPGMGNAYEAYKVTIFQSTTTRINGGC